MLRTKTTGWLGFDLGGATVKSAQAVRTSGGVRIRSAAIVPRRERWIADELTADNPLASADEMQTAAALGESPRRGPAAAVLSMSLCEAALVAAPAGSQRDASELAAIVESELHQSLDGHILANWATPWDQDKRNVIAVPAAWSDQASRDIGAGRWNCRVVDALPWALSRAVRLVESPAEPRPVIALDWGYSRATLCLIHEGVPALVRCLKNCAFQQVIASVQQALRVPELDAERLLADRRIAADPESPAATVLADAIVEPLERLQRELARTLTFWQGQARGVKPEIAFLFGGGASLAELAPRLAQSLHIDVQVWDLPAENPANAERMPPAHLLGPAIAASALAWEGA